MTTKDLELNLNNVRKQLNVYITVIEKLVRKVDALDDDYYKLAKKIAEISNENRQIFKDRNEILRRIENLETQFSDILDMVNRGEGGGDKEP